MLEDKYGADKLRNRIAQVYDGDKNFAKLVKGMGDGEILALARKLGRGLFFGSPVFDGAAETTIKSMLELAGRSTSGQAILFDGRSGEAFDQDVTVGVMY